MEETKTLIGLHIPKCAGTSFLDTIYAKLPATDFYQNTSIIRNWTNHSPEFLEIRDYKRLRLIWGHSIHEQMLHYFDHPLLFTGLRNPVTRLESEVRYQIRLREIQGREPLDVEKYVRNRRDPMCWFIIHRFPTIARIAESDSAFRKASRVLSCFRFVFFAENFATSVGPVLSQLGIELTEERKANVSPDSKMEISVDDSNIKCDQELYEWAVNRFQSGGENSENLSDSLSSFMMSDPKTSVLREFLFRNQIGEYEDWGIQHEVLSERRRLLRNLVSELDYYESYLGRGEKISH